MRHKRFRQKRLSRRVGSKSRVDRYYVSLRDYTSMRPRHTSRPYTARPATNQLTELWISDMGILFQKGANNMSSEAPDRPLAGNHRLSVSNFQPEEDRGQQWCLDSVTEVGKHCENEELQLEDEELMEVNSQPTGQPEPKRIYRDEERTPNKRDTDTSTLFSHSTDSITEPGAVSDGSSETSSSSVYGSPVHTYLREPSDTSINTTGLVPGSLPLVNTSTPIYRTEMVAYGSMAPNEAWRQCQENGAENVTVASVQPSKNDLNFIGENTLLGPTPLNYSSSVTSKNRMKPRFNQLRKLKQNPGTYSDDQEMEWQSSRDARVPPNESHIRQLKEGQCLGYDHMEEAAQLLKKYSQIHVGVLMSNNKPIGGIKEGVYFFLAEPPPGETIGHWVCLHISGWLIRVYDSCSTRDWELNKYTEGAVKEYFGKELIYELVPSPQQDGDTQCGLYAIANAFSICSDHQSSDEYNQSLMLSHLKKCITFGWLERFPTTVYSN